MPLLFRWQPNDATVNVVTHRWRKHFCEEMTRILAEEGVDQGGPISSPLLKGAQLEANQNQPGEAKRHFAEILDLEPDRPDALDAQFFHIIQGNHSFHHTKLAEPNLTKDYPS